MKLKKNLRKDALKIADMRKERIPDLISEIKDELNHIKTLVRDIRLEK